MAGTPRRLHTYRAPFWPTGQWRDGAGPVASVFLHHISRDGDPHLHVHVALWNRVHAPTGAMRDGAPWIPAACITSGSAVAPVTDRIVETRLSALRYVMVPRADGNAPRSAGQPGRDGPFSSRSRALTRSFRP